MSIPLRQKRILSPFIYDNNTIIYIPPVYEDTQWIINMHHTTPFGRPNDITVLIDGSDEDMESYITGAVSLSILILSIFLIWVLILLILKCLHKRVGCASGTPPKRPTFDDRDCLGREDSLLGINMDDLQPTPPSDEGEDNEDDGKVEDPFLDAKELQEVYDVDDESHGDVRDQMTYEEELQEWKKQTRRFDRRILIIRIFFLLCGVGNIASTIFFMQQGIDKLQMSIRNVQDSLDNVDTVLNQALNVTSHLLESNTQTSAASTDLTEQFENECLQTFNFSFPFADEVTEAIDSAGEIVTNQATNLQSDLKGIQDINEQAKESLENLDWIYVVALAFACVQMACTVVFMIGVILAWVKKSPRFFRCAQSYAFLPLFLLGVFLSCLFACIFVCTALVGADFCFDSPDDKVVAILQNYSEDELDSLILEILVYYITGCIEPVFPLPVNSLIDDVSQGLEMTHDFISEIAKPNMTQVLQACDVLTGITTAANAVDAALHRLLEIASGVELIFHCSNFNAMYTTLAYDAVCYNGVDGMIGVFISQFLIVLFSMTMVTLRASWQQVEDEPLTQKST